MIINNPYTGTLPSTIFTGDIILGAHKLKTTNLLIKEALSTALSVRDVADTAERNLYLATLFINTSLEFNVSGQPMVSKPGTDCYTPLHSYETGVGNAEIARLQGAVDPEFKLGENGNALRASHTGKLGFFTTAPQAKPTLPANTAAEIAIALHNLGLVTSA